MINIFIRIPGGVLVFFPSYSMIDKLIRRWKESYSNIYDRMENYKVIVTEPRKVGPIFDETLLLYRTSVKNNSIQPNEKQQKSLNGAVFFAVIRGSIIFF